MKNIIKIECACGCGEKIDLLDSYGRKRKFISGHNGRKYSDPTQYKREWNHRNRLSRYEYKKKYHRKKKVDCIIYRGGKCEGCGIRYDGKNACIFHLHHLDPKNKNFSIGNQVLNKAWKTIIKELKKCVLLCANCHEKKHSAEF